MIHNESKENYANQRPTIIVNSAEILKPAVRLNEAYDTKNNAKTSVCFNEIRVDGKDYIERFQIYNGVLEKYSASKLYAVGVDKKGDVFPESSSLQVSKVSVSDMLCDVNGTNNLIV